jgi:quaternary ammonium compound-resistance protein SugE
MHWLLLGIASVFEVVFALSANASKGFSRKWYTIQTFIAAAIAIYFLSLALEVLDVGVGYAIWVSIGAVGTVIFGVIIFKEKLNAGKVISILAVIAGVIALRLVSGGH